MRKTKLLPRKRKLIPKSIVKTARLVRRSLEEQDEYLRKRRMKENEDFISFVKKEKNKLDRKWRSLSWDTKLAVNIVRFFLRAGRYKTGYKDLVDMARKEYEPNL